MHGAYKIVLLILLFLMIVELGRALYYMMVDKGEGKRTVWALTRRIALSALLIGMIVLGWAMGWITPHSVGG
ncbi:MAG TPA: twin transmembrane helix small protein [Rhodanobacteraceae bacterium]|nr:twin transmembrane helix small protein [Rhodanobacteraceae bacterium]